MHGEDKSQRNSNEVLKILGFCEEEVDSFVHWVMIYFIGGMAMIAKDEWLEAIDMISGILTNKHTKSIY